MFKPIIAVLGAALLLAACDTPAPQPAAPPPAPQTTTSFMVFFDWDRSNLSQQALATVGQASEAFKKGGVRITATGHTDTSGSAEYNMALSLRRANTVKDALVRNGVPAASIATIGRGEQGLLVQTGDGVREPQNRRVEIVVDTKGMASNDMAYCKAMSDKYRAYSRANQVSGMMADAMAQCAAGNTAAGIPVLEKQLTDDKVPLPPRT